LPIDIVQLNDGDSIEIDDSGNFTVNNWENKFSIIYNWIDIGTAKSDFGQTIADPDA